MNNAITDFVAAAGLIAGNVGHAQTSASPYEVGTWQGFRTAAITFTFDDGSLNQRT